MADMEVSDEVAGEHSSEEFSLSDVHKDGKRPFVEANEGASSSLHIDVNASESTSKKPKVNKELFPNLSMKGVSSSTAIIAAASTPTIRKLNISDIGNTKERFVVEGKVLNVYGTYDAPTEKAFLSKLLKTDLVDEIGFSTVTVIFGSSYYPKFIDIIVPETCIRIEGASVCAKNPNDGGSIDFSLRVDATTSVTSIPFFKTELFFVPELTIRSFLVKAASNPNLKSIIAFVVVQVDNIQKTEGGVFEQLTIADGRTPTDRATLTFVNKRKALYYRIVDDFHRGNIVPFLARNIGVWKDKSNTLSILDMTILAPLHTEKKMKSLELAFHAQIKSLGYGKEVVGELHILNFNGSLFVKKCNVCKSQNLNLLEDGAFCYSCGAKVAIIEVVKLVGEIQQRGKSIEVTLLGDVADKVVQFEKPLLTMCKEEQGLARVLLSEVEVFGAYILDPHGQVIGFRPSTQS